MHGFGTFKDKDGIRSGEWYEGRFNVESQKL